MKEKINALRKIKTNMNARQPLLSTHNFCFYCYFVVFFRIIFEMPRCLQHFEKYSFPRSCVYSSLICTFNSISTNFCNQIHSNYYNFQDFYSFSRTLTTHFFSTSLEVDIFVCFFLNFKFPLYFLFSILILRFLCSLFPCKHLFTHSCRWKSSFPPLMLILPQLCHRWRYRTETFQMPPQLCNIEEEQLRGTFSQIILSKDDLFLNSHYLLTSLWLWFETYIQLFCFCVFFLYNISSNK